MEERRTDSSHFAEEALASSDRTGGTTKELKTDIPGWGWFAVLTDPEGSEIGLFQPLPRG